MCQKRERKNEQSDGLRETARTKVTTKDGGRIRRQKQKEEKHRQTNKHQGEKRIKQQNELLDVWQTNRKPDRQNKMKMTDLD